LEGRPSRVPMNTIMNNGWIQSIVGGLIVIGLTALSKWVFARHYLWRQAIFSISIASIVFLFGNILQPAVEFLLEGITPYWAVATAIRYTVGPGYMVLNMFIWCVIAAIPTALAVLKGISFKQRVLYGAIWAPISLTIVDIILFYLSWHSPFPLEIRTVVVNWHEAYFCLLSNLSGGVVGGFLIGAVSHLYFERLPARSSHRSPDFP
jgi:hypothetical protein